jgi:SOS-response transcriptional repressor LexA
MNNHWGFRIKKLREDRNWIQADVAEMSGLSRALIARIETGSFASCTSNTLKALAKVFEMTEGDLAKYIYDTQPSQPKLNNEILGKIESLTRELSAINADEEEIAFIELKDYGSVPAGYPCDFIQEVEQTLRIPKVVLGKDSPKDYFIVHASGDSLKDDGIRDGDILLIKKFTEFIPGKIYVINVQGQCTVKHLYKTEDGKARLVPANDSFPEMTFNEVQIIGRLKRAVKFREFD